MTVFDAIPEFSILTNYLPAIAECGEELVEITTNHRIWVRPEYSIRGYAGASDRILLRSGVYDSLVRASATLPDGLGLLVWDGLRSIRTQADIKARFANSDMILSMNPTERKNTLDKFVSPLPNSIQEFEMCPPPHTTGGAVDLTLCDVFGHELDLGAEFDQFDEEASLRYFETTNLQRLPSMALEQRNLRRTLFWVLQKEGFAGYPDEFWHFEKGTVRAAKYFGQSEAVYGPAIEWEAVGELENEVINR